MVSQRIGKWGHISSAGWEYNRQTLSGKPRPFQAITSSSLGKHEVESAIGEEGSRSLQWQSRTLASTQTGAGKRCRGTGVRPVE